MDTRKIIDFAIDDDAKEMRESLYASIYDRVQAAIDVKKQEIAHNLLGMPMATEEVSVDEETECGKMDGHEDEVDDKKLVKKMVKKSALKTEDQE